MNISGSDSSYMYQMNINSASRQRPSAEDMFKKVDSSGDGSVDSTEFESLVGNMSERTGNSIDATENFSAYDSDEDGALSSDELKSFLEANKPDAGEQGMGGMDEMMAGGKAGGPKGPPPPPPPSGESEEDDEYDIMSLLEEASEDTSSTNTYLALMESLQDSFLASSDDDSTSTSNSFQNILDSFNAVAGYTSISTSV